MAHILARGLRSASAEQRTYASLPPALPLIKTASKGGALVGADRHRRSMTLARSGGSEVVHFPGRR